MGIFSHYYATPQASVTIAVTGVISSLTYVQGNWYQSPGVTGVPVIAYNDFAGTGPDIINSGTTIPGVDNAFIVGFATNTFADSALSPGTSPNAFTSIPLAAPGDFLEYFQQATAAPVAATFGCSVDSSVYAAVVALRPPTPPAPPSGPYPRCIYIMP